MRLYMVIFILLISFIAFAIRAIISKTPGEVKEKYSSSRSHERLAGLPDKERDTSLTKLELDAAKNCSGASEPLNGELHLVEEQTYLVLPHKSAAPLMLKAAARKAGFELFLIPKDKDMVPTPRPEKAWALLGKKDRTVVFKEAYLTEGSEYYVSEMEREPPWLQSVSKRLPGGTLSNRESYLLFHTFGQKPLLIAATAIQKSGPFEDAIFEFVPNDTSKLQQSLNYEVHACVRLLEKELFMYKVKDLGSQRFRIINADGIVGGG